MGGGQLPAKMVQWTIFSPERTAPRAGPEEAKRPPRGAFGGKTVQWTVFPPNALRHAQGREIGRRPVVVTGQKWGG